MKVVLPGRNCLCLGQKCDLRDVPPKSVMQRCSGLRSRCLGCSPLGLSTWDEGRLRAWEGKAWGTYRSSLWGAGGEPLKNWGFTPGKRHCYRNGVSGQLWGTTAYPRWGHLCMPLVCPYLLGSQGTGLWSKLSLLHCSGDQLFFTGLWLGF